MGSGRDRNLPGRVVFKLWERFLHCCSSARTCWTLAAAVVVVFAISNELPASFLMNAAIFLNCDV